MSDTFKAILVTRDADKKQSVVMTELIDADLMENRGLKVPDLEPDL